VESHIVTHAPAVRSYRDNRARLISVLGPLTSLGGVVWAFAQPYRLTFLHPTEQGFWWLFVEPPLLVIVAGVAFSLLIARPLLADLEEDDAAA
jgi:hypothetical protein